MVYPNPVIPDVAAAVTPSSNVLIMAAVAILLVVVVGGRVAYLCNVDSKQGREFRRQWKLQMKKMKVGGRACGRLLVTATGAATATATAMALVVHKPEPELRVALRRRLQLGARRRAGRRLGLAGWPCPACRQPTPTFHS